MIAAVQNRRKADRRKTSRKPSWSKLAKGSYFDSVRAPVELRPRYAEAQGTFSPTFLRVKRPSYGFSTGTRIRSRIRRSSLRGRFSSRKLWLQG